MIVSRIYGFSGYFCKIIKETYVKPMQGTLKLEPKPTQHVEPNLKSDPWNQNRPIRCIIYVIRNLC